MTPELIYQMAVALVFAGAVYGGIRADLKTMNEKVRAAADAAKEAHRRIDMHLGECRRHEDK